MQNWQLYWLPILHRKPALLYFKQVLISHIPLLEFYAACSTRVTVSCSCVDKTLPRSSRMIKR
jgi:hypothetical protein